MAQITISLELTDKTIEILKLLIEAQEAKEEKSAKSKPGKSKKAAEAKEPVEEVRKDDVPRTESSEAEVTDGVSETPNITMSDVRAVALKLSKAKKQAELKEIFAKYGATKLSDIDQKHYADLMADLEAASE